MPGLCVGRMRRCVVNVKREFILPAKRVVLQRRLQDDC